MNYKQQEFQNFLPKNENTDENENLSSKHILNL